VAREHGRHLQRAFGRVIRDRRLGAGLTQESLAERAELTRNYISELERGLKSPSLATIEALARALGTRAYALVKSAELRL
jgi:transcriptional regulator with XRE-family HTH domain